MSLFEPVRVGQNDYSAANHIDHQFQLVGNY